MLIIPTPCEARTYNDIVEANPQLKPVLERIISALKRSKGQRTWIDEEAVPSAVFSTVKRLLALKHWTIEYGFNPEENYHYYALKPCICTCCAAREA
ncbi:MAG TPA: hypothetical protein V6D17_07855 [Candidatus Obscuribacterales bacterium]